MSRTGTLGDREELFGPLASMPTAWRALDRVDAGHVDAVRQARAVARDRACAAGAGPDLDQELVIDFDASILIAHSEKESAEPTWKRTFGFHPLLAFLDRPEISSGEALAGLLRPGNAGSNTAEDHETVLDHALASLPQRARPRPDDPDSPRLLARADAAGATHDVAAACRARGVGFSLGYGIHFGIQQIVDVIPALCWHPALEADGSLRDDAWVAEVSDAVDPSAWPDRTRLILQKERPHPGAQLTFADADGLRVTGFPTDTPPGVVPGQAAGPQRPTNPTPAR